MAAPQISVNGNTAGAKTAVAASSAWTATLDSIAGVRSCVWSVLSTDETSSTASYTLVQSGSVGQTVASTSLGTGTALILKVVVNGGRNTQTGETDLVATTATVKIGVLTSAGLWVGCAGEEYEHDSTFGSTEIMNSGVRLASTLSPGGIPIKIALAATTAPLQSNTRSGNVLTATANGAFDPVDNVAVPVGGRFLVQNEGGGASHINNGLYTLTTTGDGSNPWTATRATDFDETGELIQGTRFTIQQGSVFGGTERYLVTAGATVNVTALEFGSFAYAPYNAPYLVDAAAMPTGLTSAILTRALAATLDFKGVLVKPMSLTRTVGSNTVVDTLDVSASRGGAAGGAGLGPKLRFLLTNGSGTDSPAGGFRSEMTGAGAVTAKIVVSVVDAGVESDALSVAANKTLTFHGYGSGRPLLTAGVLSTSAITEAEARTAIAAAAGDVAVNQQKITKTTGLNNDAGAIDIDATALIEIGKTTSTGVKIGRSGQNVTLPGLADGTTTTRRFALLDTSGNIGTHQPAFLSVSDGTPIELYRTEASTTTTYTLLQLSVRSNGGTGGAGMGTSILMDALDAGGDAFYTGRIWAETTDATAGNANSRLGFESSYLSTPTQSGYTSYLGFEHVRFIATPDNPTSAAAAVTFDLSLSQNICHTVTEATTVSFAGAVAGQSGVLEFVQGAGFTVTMPARGAGLEYDDTLYGAGDLAARQAIVSATASKRTVLQYHVTNAPATRIVITSRAICEVP